MEALERMAAGAEVLALLVTLVKTIVRIASGLVRVAESEGIRTGAEGKGNNRRSTSDAGFSPVINSGVVISRVI